jgi:hypothetical protein
MGGKGGDEAAKEAQQARADEQARQERIRAGTKRIGNIFEGGAVSGTGRLATGAKYDPNAKYYTAEGKLWSPTIAATPTPAAGGGAAPGTVTGGATVMAGGGGGTMDHSNVRGTGGGTVAAPTAAPAALTPEQQFINAMKGGLYSGAATSKGTFNPEFYNKERQAFIDYATPQLVDQYGEAKKQLIYSMARSGNLNSSTNAVSGGELTKLYDTSKRDVVDKANSYVNETKSNVEDARNNLIQTLNATGDAEGAASGAIRRAQSLSAPPSYSPIGQLFGDFTAGLGQQAAAERAAYYSGTPSIAKYNTGIFTPGRVKVT